MKRNSHHPARRLLASAAAMASAILFSAQVSSAAPSGPAPRAAAQGTFRVVDTNLRRAPYRSWPLNRSIEISFSEDVDLSSLSPTTVSIAELSGGSSVQVAGSFQLTSPRTLVFSPDCPTTAALLDGGLAPDTLYQVSMPGGAGAPIALQSTAGQGLAVAITAPFKTAAGSTPQELMEDPLPTPPRLVVRDAGTAGETSWVTVGGQRAQRIDLERDPASGAVSLAGGAQLPLNLYSEARSQVAFVLRFDQALLPGTENIGPDNLGLVWTPPGGVAQRFPVEVEVIAACAPGGGALVRVIPQGILPQGERIEIFVSPDLADIAGQVVGTTAPLNAGVGSLVAVATDPGTATAGDGADALLEWFNDPADQDPGAPAVGQPATWGPNGLSAASGLPGAGGPNGDFDWIVRSGQVVIFDTALMTVTGGPGGVPITSQTAVGGVLSLRSFTVESGATVVVDGPNPLVVLAEGTIRIDGSINADGTNSQGVTTLNTTNIPETGARGGPGGGDGGDASPLTNQSSPQGRPGFGPFQAPGVGGQGGETGFSASGNRNTRRGAGGAADAWRPMSSTCGTGAPFAANR